MIAADRSKYLQFVLADPRYCGNNSFYTATDALLTLEAEIVQKEETPAEGEKRTQKQIERLPVVEMLRKYGLGGEREHLLLVGKPGSGKSTTLRRLCVEMAEIALGDNLQLIPVFVQLKGDKTILTLIQAEFRRAKLRVTAEQIDDLLLEDRLVLLLDGVNEIPSEQLRRELQDFRENNLTTPTIFTTRDLTVGGSLGIDKRLEMRPLTEEQMRDFVRKYLPEHGDKLLGQLRDRLREIAETPLLLKMLCEVFEPQTERIPQNKAELFELFDRKYQRHKEGVAISADFRRFQSEILQYLAFTMLQGDAQKPTEAWLTLPRDRAEGIIEAWLKQRNETNPASKAKEWLEDLVEHHLLQVAADPKQIEFHHQLFQEYYAARHLRSMLQDNDSDLVDDDRLKHFYLNYLKWTEPLGLLLGLLDDESQALRLVGLGLEVDWFLGARLAGDVNQGFQPQTVGLVDRLIVEKDLPQWLKFELWAKTRSSAIMPRLLIMLQANPSVRATAVNIIVRLGDESIVSELLPFLQEDVDSGVRVSVVNALTRLGAKSSVPKLLPLFKDSDLSIRCWAIDAIEKLGDKSNLNDLLLLLQDPDCDVRESAIDAIVKLGDKSNLDDLLPLLPDPSVRQSVVEAIVQWGNKRNFNHLLDLLLEDLDSDVKWSVKQAIVQWGDKSSVPKLLPFLQNSAFRVRANAIDIIAQLGNQSNLDDLLPLLQDHDVCVQLSAIDAIVQLGNQSNLKNLLPLLKDPDVCVRANAIDAIVQLGNQSNLKDLLPLLKDPDVYVQFRAIDAIVQLGNQSNLDDLLPLLQDPNVCVQFSVIDAIVQLGEQSNLDDLLPLLKDPDVRVQYYHFLLRVRAIDTIVQMGDKSSVPKLLTFLQDPDSYVRERAINAIVQLGEQSNLKDLLPLLKDPDVRVRELAVTAVARMGGEKAVVTLTDIVQVRGGKMREVAIESLSEITGWEKVSPLTQSLAINALLESLELKYDSVRSSAVQSLIKIGNYKILPHLCKKLAASSDNNITRIILAIQARCEFYNYDIFRSPPPEIPPSPTGNNFPNATEVKIFERVENYHQTPPQDSSS
jgi:HEAT repeat protein